MKQQPAPLFFFRALTLFWLVASLLSGCASTTERTQSMLTEGRVDEALNFIENARRNEPSDSD